MKKYILNIILFVAACFFVYDAFATAPRIRHFSKSSYKAGAQNWAVTQGPDGIMFFANSDGLLSFDGHSWSLCPVNNRTDVRSVYYSPSDEAVYVGATNEIGVLQDDGTGHLLYSSLPDLPPSGEIWNLFLSDASVVFRENNSVHIMSDTGVRTITFPDRLEICASVAGGIYAASSSISYYNGDRFIDLPLSSSLSGIDVRAILPWDGAILIVTEADGVFSCRDGAVSRIVPPLSDNVFCAAVSGSTIALGTVSDGIFIVDGSQTLHLDTSSGLQKNTVLSLCFDSYGNLWTGLNNGIDYILLSEPEWPLFGDGDPYGAGYASAVFGDRLYLGTNRGLFYMSYHGNRSDLEGPVHTYPDIHWQVWSLDVVGDALICSHDKGLDILYASGRRERIPLNGSWRVIPLRSHPDMLLGSTYDRLFTLRLQGGRWVFGGFPEGFEEASKAFEEGPEGDIWFSHWIKGLFRLGFSGDMSRVERVQYLSESDGFPTSHGNYPGRWGDDLIFSTEGGFFRWSGERAVPHDGLNSKFRRAPIAVRVDGTPDGLKYYCSGDYQAVEVPGSGLDTLSLSSLKGRRISGFESNRILDSDDILVSTDDGFSLVRVERLYGSRSGLSPVTIRSVMAGDSLYYDSWLPDSLSRLQLPYMDNSLRISYIAPNYSAEDAVAFSVMLEGYDERWSPWSTDCFKDYTRLPSGNYVFRVRARDILSADISQTSMRISVSAPWYWSWWTKLLYAIAVLALIVLLVWVSRRISDRALQKRQMEADLQKKADDLAASTMNVIRKNEMLTRIVSDLEKMESGDEDRGVTVKKIRREVSENIRHDDDWQKFSQNFDIVYQDYLKRLRERFPRLTQGDMRICAYLKMGLSSKEIAPLMNLTYRSVEMTRYRLRKKLSLSRSDNLTDFLQRI